MERDKAQEEIEHPFLEFWHSFKRGRGACIGLAVVMIFIFLSLFAPLLAPHDPTEIFEGQLRLPPAPFADGVARFPLGTDSVGRDLLSRLLYGARVSMGIGLLVVVFSATVGTFLGLVAGHFGKGIETIIMRLMDIIMALPSVLLAIVVVSILGPGLFNATLAVSFISIPAFTRLVRAGVLEEKKKQYVLASASFGAGPWRQMFSNILPNCMAPLIVQASLTFSNGILDAAALGFLGLGARPPTAEWGTMLASARMFMETSPWGTALPGLCILAVVLGFNLFGDGLRDALDPRLKR
ncbi:MAG: ABC transporter permease subunit [Bacteriovoracales bacterium]|nr:ABC transporter permease subunit [Bacteriovoracales bacterium]